MLRGPSPGDALTLLCRFTLFDVVFAAALPESMTAKLPTATAWGCLHAMRSLDAVLSAHANARNEASFFTKTLTCEEREWIALASFLSPLHEGRVANTSERAANAPRLGGKKSKAVPVVQAVVKEGLKMRGKDAEMIRATLETAEEMRDVFFRVDDVDAVTRVAAGRMLRKGKETWRIALVTAAVLEMPGVVVLGDGAELETWALDLARTPAVRVAPTRPGGGSPLHAFAATSLGMDGPTRVDDQGSVEKVRAAAEMSRGARAGGGGSRRGDATRSRVGDETVARRARGDADGERQGGTGHEGVHRTAHRLATRKPGGNGGASVGVRARHRGRGQGDGGRKVSARRERGEETRGARIQPTTRRATYPPFEPVANTRLRYSYATHIY